MRVHHSARLVGCVKIIGNEVDIGANTFVGHEVFIHGPVSIGKNCDIAPRVILHGGTHCLGGVNKRAGPGVLNKVTIGDGVWIGVGSTIIAGVSIGAGSIVAAGSVVVRSFPENVLLAGVPAKAKRLLTSAPLLKREQPGE